MVFILLIVCVVLFSLLKHKNMNLKKKDFILNQHIKVVYFLIQLKLEKELSDRDKEEIDKYIKDVVLWDMEESRLCLKSLELMDLWTLSRNPEILEFYLNEVLDEVDENNVSKIKQRMELCKRKVDNTNGEGLI